MSTDDLVQLAGQAYIYGFPLVFDLEEVKRFSESGMGSVPATPFNAFAHATQLAGPRDRFVSINNDTVYSVAQLDVSGGPVRSRSPTPTAATTCCSSSTPGPTTSPTSGTAPPGQRRRTFLLVPAGWERRARRRDTVIHFPTHVATIVGRWAVHGEADMPAVRELQAGLSLEAAGQPGAGLPGPDPAVAEELRFFEQLRVWMQAFPPGRARSRVPAAVLTARAA